MTTTTIPLLCTNEEGIFFNEILREHIFLRNNAVILSILKYINNPCQLRDGLGRTLLHLAAEYDNSQLAQHLIYSGADVNAQDRTGQTPLMLAVYTCNNVQTVRVLLEANADVFILDVQGQCALGRTFRHDFDSDIAKAFRDKITVESLTNSRHVASDVFHRDCPLYYFMPLKNPGVTRILLERGSPVDAKMPFLHETALHRATKLLDLESMKWLIKYNADVNVKDHTGRTPLAWIPVPVFKENETLEALKMLIAAGAILIDHDSRVNMVGELLTHGSRGIIRSLIQYEIDLTFEDKEGLTSLHYLAKNACAECLEELPKMDLDVNVRCREGRTLLHYAAEVRNPSSVKLLLDRGADVNAEDFQQGTPLRAAAHPQHFDRGSRTPFAYSKDCANCVEILLERGADPLIFGKLWVEYLFFGRQILDEFLKIITPIVAQLALNEVSSGRVSDTSARQFINSCSQLRYTFDSIQEQLEKMKYMKIDDSMTLFDFLSVDEKKVSRLARNKKFVTRLTNLVRECTTTPYYLRRKFLQITHLVKLRKTYLPAINDVLHEYCNRSLDNIAERIIDYLYKETWTEIL